MAWRLALERKGGPVALALTRQKLPVFDRSEVAAADGVLRGAYVLWQSGDGEPDVIVLATGSELSIALDGARSLANGAVVRVVSMPCWELFAEQPEDTATRCCRPTCGPGLDRGGHHARLGALGRRSRRLDRRRPLRRLGPYTRIYEELGLTSERVAAEAAALLQRVG